MMMVWAHPNPHAWGILGMNMEGSVVHNNIRRRATLGLLFVTIIWGWTFIWMKQATNAAEEFNPDFHEAIMMKKSKKASNIILEEFQRGYKYHDKVVRHSKVIVSE